jgi:hypothetical protein
MAMQYWLGPWFSRSSRTSAVDNFYTPKNDFFYSQSPYQPLDPKRGEIRLLKVFPPKTYLEHVEAHPQWKRPDIQVDVIQPYDSPWRAQQALVNAHAEFGIADLYMPLVACEFVPKVPMSSFDGRYCTLSYTAGNPDNTAVVLVDGLPFRAFANLEHAIRSALDAWTPKTPGQVLYLWADQICINQQDPVERSSQVGLMRDIYRRCDKTFVCLSTPILQNCLSWVPSGLREAQRARLPAHSDQAPPPERLAVSVLKAYLRETLLGKDAAFTAQQHDQSPGKAQASVESPNSPTTSDNPHTDLDPSSKVNGQSLHEAEHSTRRSNPPAASERSFTDLRPSRFQHKETIQNEPQKSSGSKDKWKEAKHQWKARVAALIIMNFGALGLCTWGGTFAIVVSLVTMNIGAALLCRWGDVFAVAGAFIVVIISAALLHRWRGVFAIVASFFSIIVICVALLRRWVGVFGIIYSIIIVLSVALSYGWVEVSAVVASFIIGTTLLHVSKIQHRWPVKSTTVSEAVPIQTRGSRASRQITAPTPPLKSSHPQIPSSSLVLRSRRRSSFASVEYEMTAAKSLPSNFDKVDLEGLLDSLEAFMMSPWWGRSWVYQEFISSPRPIFMSGIVSVPWTELWPILNFVCFDLGAFLDSMLAEAARRERLEEESTKNIRIAQAREAESKYQKRMREYESDLRKYREACQHEEQQEQVRREERHREQVREQQKRDEAARLRQEYIEEYRLLLENTAHDLAKERTATKRWKVPLRLKLKYQKKKLERGVKEFDQHIDQRLQEARTGKVLNRSGENAWRMHKIIEQDRLANPELYVRYYSRPFYSSQSRSTPYPPEKPSYEDPSDNFDHAWRERKTRIASIQMRIQKLHSESSVVSSTLIGKINSRRSCDLKDLLQHSRNCKASDLRDRVYAFLGLAHKEYAIVANYTMRNTVVQVLIETARKIIEYDKTLDLLNYVGHGQEELDTKIPSWVPNWTSKRLDSGIDSDMYELAWPQDEEPRPFNASIGMPTEVDFRSDPTNEDNIDLKVRGVLVGILCQLEEHDDHFADLRSFLLLSNEELNGRELAADDKMKVLAPERVGLYDEVWVLHGAARPVVLRPEQQETCNKDYAFLGHVLVLDPDGGFSDVMFGEMILKAER